MPDSLPPPARAHPARVSAQGWGWRYASRTQWALQDLDVVIEPGERVLLLGPSGSGKSTLLQAIAGVLGGADEGQTRGTLRLGEHPPAESRGRAGLVLQDPDSQVILARVGDDVAFGCENLGVPREEIWPRVRRALDDVGLDVALDRSTSQLSGGQKQRLALAGVLAMRPEILLLDEPTANLDSAGALEVRDAVARVLEQTGATLVVVEHRVDMWLPLVDRVIVVSSEGRIAADGSPEEVLRSGARSLADAGVWVPGHPPPLPRRVKSVGASLLTAHDVTVGRAAPRWSGRGKAVPGGASGFALHAPDIDVHAGMATAITGPNGSGKTTLGLTLGGLLPPVTGAVLASAQLRAGALEQPIRWKSRELLTRIGTVFQDPEHQFLKSTVREEISVGLRALKLAGTEVETRTNDLLERMRLGALAEANPFTLSGGEKRRLSVATVLATRPRIMVLDEPTFGQDAGTWRELVALLAELVDNGQAMIAMTHDQLFVDTLADRQVRL